LGGRFFAVAVGGGFYWAGESVSVLGRKGEDAFSSPVTMLDGRVHNGGRVPSGTLELNYGDGGGTGARKYLESGKNGADGYALISY
jgi:hypothetical protein